jgi:pyruvate,orthophosphate dikinase
MTKFVASFDDLRVLVADQSASALSETYGEKATRLAQANSLGEKIPQGYVVSTAAFKKFVELGLPTVPDDVWTAILSGLGDLEKRTGFKYGGASTPLLLSCRCDAPDPMPGMLDTVINVGLNDLTVRGLSRISGNRAFVWDSYRRLVQSYGSVVLKIAPEHFETLLSEFSKSRKRSSCAEFTDLDWIEVTKLYKSVIMRKTGNPFPQDPLDQLRRVIGAIFASFGCDRLKAYRKFASISDGRGISIIVSQMIFGNNSPKSFAAVVTSRSPVDGSPGLSGDFARNALVMDIALGLTPAQPIHELVGPELAEIQATVERLERFYKRPQVIDFVADEGRVHLLQTRYLSFAVSAKFQAIWDMSAADILTPDEALAKIEPNDLRHLMMPVIADRNAAVFCRGICAGNRTVVGTICLSSEKAAEAAPADSVVLVKTELFPRDFRAFIAAKAIVTARGGNNSHAAYLSRATMATAAIGCEGLTIDLDKRTITCGDVTLKEGAPITVCGNGIVVAGAQQLEPALGFENAAADQLLQCADGARKGKLTICTIASSPAQVGGTAAMGADAVGLFPMESLFGEKSAILIRALLDKRRDQALKKIQDLIEKRMTEVFAAAKSMPVAVRLFSPQFYTFHPNMTDLAREIGSLKARKEMTDEEEFNEDKELDKKTDALETIKGLQEKNQIFGLKGIRLNLVQKEFLVAQVRGILVGVKAAKEAGEEPRARILLPGVGAAGEIDKFIAIYNDVALDVGATAEIGSELGLPRSCLTANAIADHTKFLLIQPAELTEATFAADRIPAERTFLKTYRQWGFLAESPFQTIDRTGVGELVKMAVKKAKQSNPAIEIGVCGEMSADPKSIAFFYEVGVQSITCDYAAVPIARLCSAQAVITATNR